MGARTYVAFVTFAWVSVMLFIGSLGAFLGAPEAHAPLFITLILTSVATLFVAAISVSLQGIKDEEESTQRATATFVFINSAGVLVGIVTDLSEVLEIRRTSEINNGLTYLYGRVSDQSIPVWLYAPLLTIVLIFAVKAVIRGAKLLSADRQVSEDELQQAGAYSMSLLALWILVCLPWNRLPLGSELVARGWTLTLYAVLVALSVWYYGRWSVRGIALFIKAIANLQNRFAATVRSPLTWKIVLITFFATVCAYLFAKIISYLLALIVSALDQSEGIERAEARDHLVDSSWDAVLQAGAVLGWFIAAVFVAACLWFVGTVVKRGLSESVTILAALIHKVKLPPLPRLRLSALGFAVSSWMLVSVKATKYLKYPTLVLAASLFLFAVFRLTLGWWGSDNEPSIKVIPPVEEIVPFSVPVSLSESAVEFKTVSTCSISGLAPTWAYGSDDRFDLGLRNCIPDFGKVDPGQALVHIGLATLGNSVANERERALNRARSLAGWTSGFIDDEVSVFGLSLGMSKSKSPERVLYSAFSAAWSERPAITVLIAPVSGIEALSDENVIEAVSAWQSSMPELKVEFDQCRLFKFDKSTDALLQIHDCGVE